MKRVQRPIQELVAAPKFKLLIQIKGDPYELVRGVSRMYKGAYSKIFKILHRDLIFSEGIYDTQEGTYEFLDGKLVLPLSDEPDSEHLVDILKIKNVSVHPETIKHYGV